MVSLTIGFDGRNKKPRPILVGKHRYNDKFCPPHRDSAYAGEHTEFCEHCRNVAVHKSWDARYPGRSHNHLGRALWWMVCTMCETSTDLC